jgi:hypothetical protein
MPVKRKLKKFTVEIINRTTGEVIFVEERSKKVLAEMLEDSILGSDFNAEQYLTRIV